MKTSVIRSLVIGLFLSSLFAIDTHAQGNFVYVNTNNSANSVTAFSAASNGTLTPIAGSPFLTGGIGNNLGLFAANRSTVCMTGNRLYVANDGSSNVTGFDINPATGFLTVIPGSPFIFGDGINSLAAVLSPNGRLLFVTNQMSGIAVLNVASRIIAVLVQAAPGPSLT